MTQTIIAIKFVSWDVPELATLTNSRVYQLRQKVNAGMSLTRSDKYWLTNAVNSNAYFKQGVQVQGWRFDFSDILRRYWVKQYGHIC